MIFNLKLVRVDYNYCDYLRTFDSRVAYNKDKKELRPFVGILFTIKNCEYFAPLASPKPKYLKMRNTIDFFKIQDGKLGAVNFNNMIPVNKDNYATIYFKEQIVETESEQKYQQLLMDQLNWLNENYIQVQNKAFKLYDLYNKGRLGQNIASRCCNFKLLEEKCALYNKKQKNG